MNVSEYMREFEQLLVRGGIDELQEQIMARFLDWPRKVELQTYFTLDDVFKLALNVEKWRKEKKVFSKPFSKDQVSPRPPFKPFSHPKY